MIALYILLWFLCEWGKLEYPVTNLSLKPSKQDFSATRNVLRFQVEYDAHYTQINFLRTLSNYANQNVTYACRNSKAWEDGQHSIKLMGSNDMEYHASSKISLRPTVIMNECAVSKWLPFYFIFFPFFFLSFFLFFIKVGKDLRNRRCVIKLITLS